MSEGEMGKRGPKPKQGVNRTPTGRISESKTTVAQLNAMEAEKREKVMELVKSQPHRKGAADKGDPWLENALGRFCRSHGLGEDVYNGCRTYDDVRRRWKAAKGAPSNVRLSEGIGIGDGPSAATVEAWRLRLDNAKMGVLRQLTALRIISPEYETGMGYAVEAWLWAEAIVVDDLTPPERSWTAARNGLVALSVEMLALPKDKRRCA